MWRFAIPENGGAVVVRDLIHGEVSFDAGGLGDFVLLRSDGSATYDLANVVDDHEMAISTVVRGDDHLANTPRHMMLYASFGWDAPRFAHLPLVVDATGAPLSKSAGGSSVRELRDAGIPAAAVVGYLATMGWAPPEGCDLTDTHALAGCFDLQAVSASPARHDTDRLRAMSAHVIREWDPLRLAAALGDFVTLPEWLDPLAFAEAVRDELGTLADAEQLVAALVSPDSDAEATEALGQPGAPRALELATGLAQVAKDGADFSDRFKADLRSEGISVRTGMMAARAALLGKAHGMPLADIVDVLGCDRAQVRLSNAADLRQD